MATVEDYTSGKVCELVGLALSVFDSSEGSLQGTEVGEAILKRANQSEPTKLSQQDAIDLINQASQWAIGERVCRASNKNTPLTESVFLDELAEGMVEAGKARLVSKEEAIENMKKYRKQPIIVSKVSGKHAEICPTWAKRCLFWNMEKHKLKCIQRSL